MFVDFHTHKTKVESNVFSIYSHSVGNPHSCDEHYLSVGLHPWDISKVDVEHALAEVESLMDREGVIMVGECGLDHCHGVSMAVQQQVFERHVLLSEQYAKPLVIHCVRAFDELLALKKRHKPQQTWVVHGFANNISIARRLVSEGILLSFGQNLFNPNGNSAKIIRQMTEIPFFLETDDSSISIAEVHARAAEVLQTDMSKLQNMMIHNMEEILNRRII